MKSFTFAHILIGIALLNVTYGFASVAWQPDTTTGLTSQFQLTRFLAPSNRPTARDNGVFEELGSRLGTFANRLRTTSGNTASSIGQGVNRVRGVFDTTVDSASRVAGASGEALGNVLGSVVNVAQPVTDSLISPIRRFVNAANISHPVRDARGYFQKFLNIFRS